MNFRLFLCAAATAGLLLTALPVQAAPLIGYVDLQRAILQVEEGQEAKKKLEKTMKAKQKELTKKKEELEALGKKLSEGELTAAESEQLVKRRTELQETFVKEQTELQKLEREILGKIMTRMQEVIKKVGKKGDYAIILEVQGNRLLYAQDQLDLTNEVIRTYNRTYGAKGARGRK